MGIDIEILEADDNSALVKATQKRVGNGFYLSQKQIADRVKSIFEPTGIDPKNVKVISLTNQLDLSLITPEWIDSRMEEFNLKRSDLINHLGIDKTAVSRYLNGTRRMNKMVKSAFFWYFLTYQINRDLREQL